MIKYSRLLRDNPDFARLWLAQVVSLLGDWFGTSVLSTLVVRYSPGSEGLAVSGLLLARFIPSMLISPVAGVLVDRFDRKWLLGISNLLRVGVVLMFLLTLDNPGLLWLIYLLSVIQFILSSVFEPGQSSLIPNLVRREDLVLANTLISVTWSVMLALGAVAGGVVATLFGTAVALMINAMTFMVATLLIMSIRVYTRNVDRVVVGEVAHSEDKGFIEGLRFLRRTPEAASALLVKFGNSLGNVDTLMAIFATQIFVMGTDGQLSLGIMYSAFGLGAIAGPLILNRFNDGSPRVMRRLIGVGFFWVVLGWLALGGASSLLIVCLALMMRAMGGSANWTYSTIIIQKTVPDSHLGRVFSIDMALFYLATVLSTLVHGAVIDAVGVEEVRLVALGTMVVSVGPLLIWLALNRWLNGRQAAPLAVAGD